MTDQNPLDPRDGADLPDQPPSRPDRPTANRATGEPPPPSTPGLPAEAFALDDTDPVPATSDQVDPETALASDSGEEPLPAAAGEEVRESAGSATETARGTDAPRGSGRAENPRRP